MRRSNRFTPLALALCATSLLACEPRDEPVDTSTASGALGGSAADPLAGSDTAAAGASSVDVVLAEWKVGLDRDTVPAGRVTLRATNSGEYEHALEVEGGGEEWETERVRAGQEATLQVDLGPGTYEVYCPIEDAHGNHERLGMRTTLVVR